MDNRLSMDEKFLKKLVDILESNLENEQFGVEQLADAMGLSRSQLHRKLNAINGKSTSQFIREFRLEKAMEMLQNNVATASEIAYRVGFNSPTYFNTRFKDYFGYPPGEVRVRAHLDKDLIPSNTRNQPPFSNSRKGKTVFLIVTGTLLVLITLFFLLINRTPSNQPSISDISILTDSLSQEKTIAVLPLKNWSGDPELEYISDGMTDAIIGRLANIRSIKRVVPFTSMLSYKQTDKSITEISKELGVKNILQGSFQLSGENVSVKLQLIDGITEDQFWESNYNSIWKSNEIFEMQAAVAENVAENINAKITETEQKSIHLIPTMNREAYKLHLQAQYQFNQLSLKGIEKARPLYKRAIALDSTFINPYIGLATDYLLSGLVWGISSEEEAWSNAKPIFQRALKIDQSNSGVYQERIKFGLLNGLFLYEWDLESYEEAYVNAPDKTTVFLYVGDGFSNLDYARKTGRHNDALAIANNVLDKLPTQSQGYVHKACCLYFLGRKEEAIDLLAEHDELYDDDYFYLMETAKYYYYLGAQEKFKKQLELFKKHFTVRPPIINWLNAIHAEMEGKSVTVKEILKTLENQFEQKTSGSPAWFTALYYCHIKDYNSAFEWLQRSYDRHEVEMTWLKVEPVLRPLRNDPRYLKLYEKVGFSILDK